MAKRITALIIMFCLSLSLTSLAYEKKEYQSYSADIEYSVKLIESLCKESIDVNNSAVSRGDFLVLLINLITHNPPYGMDCTYADVEKGTPVSYCAYYANKSGIISDGESFFPNQPVTSYEAVKMAVSALGYDDLALAYGGYPAGYLKIASDVDIDDGIDLSSEVMSMGNVCTLLYNTLNAELYEISGINDGYAKYERKGSTILDAVHGISVIEGVVTSDRYTSLTSPDGGTDSDAVVIGNYTIKCEDGRKFLGMNVRAYVRDSSGSHTAVALIPSDNVVVAFDTNDYPRLENGKILLDDDKQKKFSLSKAPVWIVNGKSSDVSDAKYILANMEVTARIIDPDSDGIYDTVIVDVWKYCVVKTANVYGGVIADKYSLSNNIDFSRTDCEYEISGDGITDIYDVCEGMLLAHTLSEDGSLVSIRVVENTKKLVINGFADSELHTSDGVYRFGEYFSEHCLQKPESDETVTVYFGVNGEAVCISEPEDKYSYGLIMAHTPATGLKNPQLKLISQDGRTCVFDVPQKISADGEKISSEELIRKIELLELTDRLIRYKVSADGVLKNIDFCSGASGVPCAESANTENSLSFYDEGTYTYKSTTMTLSDRFNISSAKVFVVPTDESDFSAYRVNSSGVFHNDQKITLRIYDVNSVLDAGAVVWVSDAKSTVSSSERSCVVCSVTSALDSEGDSCYALTVFNGSTYVKYFSDEKTESEISNLNPGDLVRFALSDDGEKIEDIICEYSCKDDSLLSTYSSGAIVDYIKGRVYDVSKSRLSLIEKSRSNAAEPSKDNLRSVPVSGDFIYVHVNMKPDGTPEKARVAEYNGQAVQGYISVSDAASYAVIERNYYSTRNVFIYIFEE